MSLLEKIHSGKRQQAPRLMIYGSEGIGKSTLAANAPKPIFVATEDGLDQIACDSFPLAKTYSEAMNCFQVLANEQHDYKRLSLTPATGLSGSFGIRSVRTLALRISNVPTVVTACA